MNARESGRGRGVLRAPVNPALLRWARERSGLAQEDLESRFSKLAGWEGGEVRPTLKQVEAFARAVHAPVGYLFLSEPPEEPEAVPIPDFRTFTGRDVMPPSPNLLDTIYACQERQDWYRDYARVAGQPELGFVGSVSVETPPRVAAAGMRETLGLDFAARRRECSTWTGALRMFVRRADEAGVLVMVSGVVMSNTRRRLNPEEFSGFALSDPLSPLVFVNGADTKAAQVFTLACGLAHIWLGVSALSNLGAAAPSPSALGFRREEVWCNAVATEPLVPLDGLRKELRDPGSGSGQGSVRSYGGFYRTTTARVGRRFARALVVSTLEGQTLYRDAFRMLGISQTSTFRRLGREVGATG